MAGLIAPHRHDESAARAYLEKLLWPEGPVCPKCGLVGNAYKLEGETTRDGLYKCGGCRAPFTVTMGTIFEDSHIPLHKWLFAIYLMCSSKKGMSAHQLWRNLWGVNSETGKTNGSYKSAWFMAHRIRWALGQEPIANALKGVFEIDELWIGGKQRIRPVIYIDGQRFGDHHVISGVGIDRGGSKHILGIELGATENAAAVKNLLTGLRDRGLRTDQQYLFVIDGAKALRAGIEAVFGSGQPVQRCRNHKMNVLDELPREQHAQVVNVMRAAWKLTDFDEGMKRLEGLARFLEHDYESAARSLREGMGEMFTIQKLKLPPTLYTCLGTTNVIESPQSGVQKRTNNVTRWRDGAMVERWVASAWLLTEKHFRKVIGHKNFWALAVILGREKPSDVSEKVA